MRKSRCKNVCCNCGLPITKVTKKHKPHTFKDFKGDWVHAIPVFLTPGYPNYFFMCGAYPENKGKRILGGQYAQLHSS